MGGECSRSARSPRCQQPLDDDALSLQCPALTSGVRLPGLVGGAVQEARHRTQRRLPTRG
eukprot:2056631-Rhodomonas_salina.4